MDPPGAGGPACLAPVHADVRMATHRCRLFSHLTADAAPPLLCDWDVGRIALTQIGRTAPPHDKLEREVRRRCARAVPAYDGLVRVLDGCS